MTRVGHRLGGKRVKWRFKIQMANRRRSEKVGFHLLRGSPLRHPARTKMEIKQVNSAPPFITKDGSEIRELLAYRNSSIRNQSLAEACLPAGSSTQEHYHARTEEIYFITSGRGRMRIEHETAEVQAGDAI